jgi:uracil-DNA glycosylase family 4
MQGYVGYVLASSKEESSLYIRTGGQVILDKQQHFRRAVRNHFKKTQGSKPKTSFDAIPLPDPAWSRESLVRVLNDLCPSKVCSLAGPRKVFFKGSMKPKVVFVGEAPGAVEEETGVPFAGKAGEMLGKLIIMFGFKPSEYAVTNTVLCRPPGNRDPHHHEKLCCLPRLLAFLEKLKPRAVVAVGKVAASTFFPIAAPQKGESNLPLNCIRAINNGVMRFVHIRHPMYWGYRGGLLAAKNKEEIDDTVFTMGLLRDFLMEKPVKGKWSWTVNQYILMKREINRMNEAMGSA